MSLKNDPTNLKKTWPCLIKTNFNLYGGECAGMMGNGEELWGMDGNEREWVENGGE